MGKHVCPGCGKPLSFGSKGIAKCCNRLYELKKKRKPQGQGRTALKFKAMLTKQAEDLLNDKVTYCLVIYPAGFYKQYLADVQCVTGWLEFEKNGRLSFGSWDKVSVLIKGMNLELVGSGRDYADIVISEKESEA